MFYNVLYHTEGENHQEIALSPNLPDSVEAGDGTAIVCRNKHENSAVQNAPAHATAPIAAATFLTVLRRIDAKFDATKTVLG